MCDTFYIRRPRRKLCERGMTGFFAKNSDRDPNESQYMFFVPAGQVSRPKTYVEMPSYVVEHDVWLSKPSWMWGAEMGVNAKGVSIGNEAIFSRVSVDRTGVLGMDHLRAALELASTAREAVELIVKNTERHGQGGDGGFERPLYYHNSYLIADPDEGYVLETVDRYYAYKKLDGNYHISNKLSIEDDYDEISPQLKGKVKSFQRRFTNPVVSYAVGAYHRENRGQELMQRNDYDAAGVISLLQDRCTGRVASMRNIGMIAGGLVSSQATASLFYDYDRNLIWYTEGPGPEIQLFKPLSLAFRRTSPETEGVKRWKRNNLLFRVVLKDYVVNKDKLYDLRAHYQDRLFELSGAEGSAEELDRQAQALNSAYIDEALKLVGDGPFGGGVQFGRYWKRQNKALLEKEECDELKEVYRRYLE